MGINIRHLGRIRSLVKEPHVRKILLTEMVARTLKNGVSSLLQFRKVYLII